MNATNTAPTGIFAGIGNNLILQTDSYKASHWLQYPPGSDGMFSYVEARGGAYPHTLFFGLQTILMEYFSRPVTQAMVDEAAAFFAAHGEPFNRAGWQYIVDRWGGRLPLRIRAVPEGSLVPLKNALVTVESTDPECFWVVSWIEPLLLRLWYPVTVATRSWHLRRVILNYLEDTSDDPAGQIGFKLHDFGARGVSSSESAALGGAAHLVSFLGSDNLLGVLAANRYYDHAMAGYSIPAAEHSTITSWGREGEAAAYANMVTQFGKPGAIFACVSDSYDLYHAVEHLWGEALRDQVRASGATLVVRPDSGNPPEVVLRCAELLAARFGTATNSKGYKVLEGVRMIQGDGITDTSIAAILARLRDAGFAADNIAFGMGGGLLQQLDRDTLQFAMKCSAIHRGEAGWQDVFKAPVTDPAKTSKRGRLTLLLNGRSGEYLTTALREGEPLPAGWIEALETVWENGELLRRHTLDEVRARALAGRS